MITSIIFDLGGVLFTNGTKKFVMSLSERTGFSKEEIKEIVDGKIGTQYRMSEITRDEFWKHVKDTLHLEDSADSLEDEWINGYLLIEETRDIIFELSKKYKVYYLSDNIRERVRRLNNKHDFLKWFEDGVFSHEVGFRKPHPKIYEHTLEKLGLIAEESVFIDDVDYNLEPARRLGMSTILFKSPDGLRKELGRLQLL